MKKPHYPLTLEDHDIDKKLEGQAFHNRKEIASHSSFLTNRRIDLIFQSIDHWALEAFQNPTASRLSNLRAYFAVTNRILNNCFGVFEDNELKEMVVCRDAFLRALFSFNPEGEDDKGAYRKYMEMYYIVERLEQMLRGALQKQQYFFKTNTRDASSIDEGLKIIKIGGGIFGGKTIRELDGKPAETSPQDNDKSVSQGG